MHWEENAKRTTEKRKERSRKELWDIGSFFDERVRKTETVKHQQATPDHVLSPPTVSAHQLRMKYCKKAADDDHGKK